LFRKNTEITIIGGGIIGTAMAYYLSRQGRDVTLVEKRYFASEASGANGGNSGGYGAGLHNDLNKYRFSQIREQGRQIYGNLSEELEIDIEYRNPGGLTLIRHEDLEAFQKLMEAYSRAGLDVRFLTPEDVRQIEPELKGEIGGALFAPGYIHINPHLVVQGFAEAARTRHNLKIHTGTSVTGIRLSNGKVQAVETDRGIISTKIIVNAAGAWAPEIGAMVGCDIPILPRRGQVFVTHAVPKCLNHVIGVAESTIARTNFETMEAHDTPEHPTVVDGRIQYRVLYGRQTASGQILFGGRSEFVGLNKQTTREGIGSVMAHVLEFFPGFKDLLIVRTWAGIMPYTPDGKPILGAVPNLEGFYLATGLCGGGMGTGPFLAQLMTKLINRGERPGLFDDTSINRFSKV